MSGRTLVTGGGSGIGAAIAQRCREDGFETVTIDQRGGDITADLADPTETKQAVDEALTAGPITRLVNNVGVAVIAPIEEATLDQLDRSVRVNLQAAIISTQALVPGMKDAGFGRIVSIASRAALGKEGRGVYSATKAGLIGLTRTLALELGRSGITVNAVGPGPIETPMFTASNPPGAPETEAIINSIPVARMGQPEDVAHAVAGFLDSRAGFITGQTLYVCGGKTVGAVAL